MVSAAPDIGVARGIERGLLWTIILSAIVHAAALVVLVALPGQFLSAPPRIESYTVDLIAPEVVGGTNLSGGRGHSAQAAAPVVPPLVPLSPTDSEAVAPPAAPPPIDKPAKPAAEPPAPQAAPERKAIPPPPAPVKAPEPKPPPVKAVEPPKAPEPPKPAAPKPAEVKPVAKEAPQAVKPPVKPATKSEVEPKPPAKVETKPEVVTRAKADAVAADKKPAPPPVPSAPAKKPPATVASIAKAAPTAEPRDQAIAAAVQRRAEQMKASETNKPGEADQRIAAAVQRRAAQVEKSGNAQGGGNGPVSSGPASGAGGTPTDLQYILYHGRMIERIKAAWAWAGADKTLHVVVQFNIDPDGQIKNVRVVQSSGDPQYDLSAERAIRAVNPLDPVPEKFRDAFATQEITFQASDLES